MWWLNYIFCIAFGISLFPLVLCVVRSKMLIKEGLQHGKNMYPTFDDIKSDWSGSDNERVIINDYL
uniref:G_PROTEIN_RECEP_F1_2 domain-containing protein n=1 Tax=Heterorhabditis bacteriophora TaxID=37862 RepID=A0A1I7X6P6_HETBA